MKITKLLLTLSLCSTLQASDLKLRYVIDGDTVVFSPKITCRLAYIDTPESKRNNKAQRDLQASLPGIEMEDIVWAGRLAKKYTKSIMPKGRYYHVDITGKDRYGRKICKIYDQGESINEKIIRNGFAVPFFKYIPRSLHAHMQKLNKKAREEKKGLWRAYPKVLASMEGR